MSESTGNMEGRCIFPKLEASCPGNPQFGSIDMKPDSLEDIAKGTTKESTSSLFDLVQCAWSILLSKYTDSDTITFGVIASPKMDVMDQLLAVIDECSPISHSVRLQKVRKLPTMECDHQEHFNTCLLFEDVITSGWISNAGDGLSTVRDPVIWTFKRIGPLSVNKLCNFR